MFVLMFKVNLYLTVLNRNICVCCGSNESPISFVQGFSRR